MESNMLLMITLAIVLALVFYKPEPKIEGFIATTDSRWTNAPSCTQGGTPCGEGSKCINERGVGVGTGESGRCLSCKNNSLVRSISDIGCALGPVPITCPECEL
jgi:hypothetical protein